MTDAIRRTTPGHLIWRLSMKWRAAVDAAVAPLGLTHAKYVVLASLRGMARASGPPHQRHLADFTGLDPIYVSKLVRKLEQAGLIHRTTDPLDARARGLTITNEGVRVIDQAIEIVRNLQDRLTAPLGGTDGQRMTRLMRDLETLIAVPTPLDKPDLDEKGTKP